MPKNFSHRELLARLNALMRRVRMVANDGALEEAGIVIDPARHMVSSDGVPIELTVVEFDILLALMRGRGRVLSREQLLEEASQRGPDVSDRSVDVHISSLRRKLGPEKSLYVETVRSLGYRFQGPVGA